MNGSSGLHGGLWESRSQIPSSRFAWLILADCELRNESTLRSLILHSEETCTVVEYMLLFFALSDVNVQFSGAPVHWLPPPPPTLPGPRPPRPLLCVIFFFFGTDNSLVCGRGARWTSRPRQSSSCSSLRIGWRNTISANRKKRNLTRSSYLGEPTNVFLGTSAR